MASSPVHFDRKENLLSSWNERAADIVGLTLVTKPLETYLVVREWDGDRELNPAECEKLLGAGGWSSDA